MKIAIHQPNFLPRLKVLQKISASDTWVVLDSVQFARRDWQHRTRILPAHIKQSEFWLSLNVNLPNGINSLIKDVTVLRKEQTIKRCRDTLWYTFRSAKYWNTVSDYWDETESEISSSYLCDFVLPTMNVALRRFGRLPDTKFSNILNIPGRKSKLMANISLKLNANVYLADSGAINYLELNDFEGVRVYWQHWLPPTLENHIDVDWKNLSFLCYLAEFGPNALHEHLNCGKFTTNPPLA